MVVPASDASIYRIFIVDDDENVRNAYELSVEDAHLIPVSEPGPLRGLTEFVRHSREVADAAICDYHLRMKDYATFNGAELVAEYYRNHFPAILCTKWESAVIDEVRAYRRYIPVLLKPEELEPDAIAAGIKSCIEEIEGNFRASRRPWRTVVRVEDVESQGPYPFIYVVVPGWDPNVVLRLRRSDLPERIGNTLQPGDRLHAMVNLGAEREEDLYFTDWEPE